ncbi:HNH endonuclease signature motif containing protein [Arthrobacter sp. HLT1-20]
MGGSVNFPDGWEDSSTTVAVAELVAAIVLPSIEPLVTDMEAVSALPCLPSLARGPGQVPPSQLGVVQALMDECVGMVAAFNGLANRTAAALAAVLERYATAAATERRLLGLDKWQNDMSMSGSNAEIGTVLGISEAAANGLVEHCTVMVRELPATHERVGSGELGWPYAVIIAEETMLLRNNGLPAESVTEYEGLLLGKAQDCSLNSFKGKARRLREHLHPESIPARTRNAFQKRSLGVSRAHDGMSWLSLYAPAATVEGIWDQCTLTAQSAQGPHEPRTLTQLRADVAAALLLNQPLAQNSIHTPPTPTGSSPHGDATFTTSAGSPGTPGGNTGALLAGAGKRSIEPDPCAGAPFPDADNGLYRIPSRCVPVFDDPDYRDPGFMDPDVRNHPDWHPNASPPRLQPVLATDADADYCGVDGPPLPRAVVLVSVPALSLLGHTNAPAVLEGYGPISVEIAKRLLAGSSSFYRVLTDPITNEPLDLAPDSYRVGKAMRLMLRGRDHYCQFPGCTAKASLAELDHLLPWERGGRSTKGNLEYLCKRHHLAKHFRDGKTRTGKFREHQSQERRALKLRGWTAVMTANGRPGWTSPSGRYHPPQPLETQAARYPKWLKKNIQQRLDAPYQDTAHLSLLDENEMIAVAIEEDYCTESLPEPPDWAFPDTDEGHQQLAEQSLQYYLNEPHED